MQIVVRQVVEIPDFRKRLRLELVRRGMTMADLAEKVGIARHKLGKKLARGRITERSLRDIEAALGVTRDKWTEPLRTRQTEAMVLEFMRFEQLSAPRRQAAKQRQRRSA